MMANSTVVLTPQIAGCTDQFAELFWRHLQTLRAMAARQSPLWRVNPEIVPRSLASAAHLPDDNK